MRGPVVIHEPERTRHVRLASDLVRLIASVVVALLALLVAALLDDVSAGVTVEVIEVFVAVPDPIVVVIILALQLLTVAIPVLAVAALLWRRTYRRLTIAAVAAAAGGAAAWVLENTVLDRLGVEVAIETPTWICDPARSGDLGACVPGDGFPTSVYLAAVAAAFSALTPWLGVRWRRFVWLLLALFLVVRTIDGIVPPIDALIVTTVGYAIGAGVVLAIGATDPRPGGREVVDALARHGIDVDVLRAADVPARNSAPWFATTADGTELFVKVIGPEERAADLLYRGVRAVRLKDAGDAPPFLTVRREVEHEAAISLAAWSGGVHTPQLVAAGEVGTNSMMLAFEAVHGCPLDRRDTIPPDTLRDMWEQVAAMRRRRIAHRNLGLGNFVVDDDGRPWITDFGFSELAADDGQLDGDVAQLLASTAIKAGPERAVSAAVEVLGPTPVERAAPRLQPAALGSSTRSELAEHDGLLDELHGEVAANTRIETVELAKLERVTLRAVLTVAMLGVAFYLLIPQLAEVSFEEISSAEWRWFALALLFSLFTYVGAAVALIGAIPDRIRFVPTLEAQVGGSFVNRISPVKIGGMATNLRYLQRSGVEPPVAVAGVGVSSVVGFIVHVTLLVVFVTTAGRSASDSISTPSGEAVLVGLVVVMTVAGLIALVPFGRRIVRDRVWPILKESVAGIVNVASRPSKVLALFGGSFVITTSYMLALWYCVEAFGGGIGFVSVGAVYLAGQAIAQAAPTPGGVGAAEAALIAGLTAFGLDAEVAVPAVFLYRFATFWLPILPGWLAVRHLLRTGAL